MPPSIEEDISEGLKLTIRDGEVLSLWRTWFAKDLEGASAAEVMASALNFAEIPEPTDGITVFGRTVYPNDYDVDPVPPNDATVRIVYKERNLAIGTLAEFGLCTVSGGTSLRQIESDFDATELAKPFLQRTPIFVAYDPGSTGAPSMVQAPSGTTVVQAGRVPMYLPESSVTFTRFERTYPDGRSRQYAGKRNAVAYEGCPIGTLLMWAVTFNQIRSDLFQTSYTLVYDPYMFWNAVLRYTDPYTGLPPKLSKTQLAGQNGIKEIVTQESVAFQALNLVLA